MSELSTKIAETVPIFFFVFNLHKKDVEFISPQFYELAKGIEKGDKDSLKKCIHADDQERFTDFFSDLSDRNRYEGSIELRVNDTLPDMDWVEINTFPVKDKNASEVQQVVGHMVNISQKKEIYETLKEEKEHISTLLNMMVHDLRAPFNRIQMIAELMENSMTEAEYEKYKSYLSMLRKQGQHSMALIQRLLRLATLKGQASSLDLNIEDLRSLIRESVSLHQVRLDRKKLKVVYQFPEQHVKAKLDAVLFRQVITNLLSNAIKYTPSDGTIGFGLSYKDKHIILEVSDNGIGIPEKHLKSLFQNVQGIRRPGLEGEESTGIGLFICREIVKIHHGKISVESTEGAGTTFTISLPIPESSAAYY